MGMSLSGKLFLVPWLIALLAIMAFSLSGKQVPAGLIGGAEQASPSDWIQEHNISVQQDRVVLEIENPLWASFTDTNSMDPLLDESAHAIEIMPKEASAIHAGDVIAYKTGYGVVIHRVVNVSEDNRGIYYQVKGDNNRFQDPFKVRFEEVRGVVVAVIY